MRRHRKGRTSRVGITEPPATSGAPYSAVAVTQSTTTFSDGNRIVRTNTVRYFRDGQGRTRVERPVGGDGGAGSQSNVMITVTDPVSGQLYFIRPESKSVEAIKLSPQLIAAQAGHLQARTDGQVPFALLGIGMGIGASLSTEAATSEISLGQKSVNGVNATGTRIVRTFPAGVLGNEKPVTSKDACHSLGRFLQAGDRILSRAAALIVVMCHICGFH